MLRATAALPGKPGAQHITVAARCAEDLTWVLTLSVDGAEQTLGPVPQLVGMAPFTGISVGVDYGSPVDWDRWERSGDGRYTGANLAVTYLPGSAIAGGKLLARIDEVTGRLID
jgi:hypothetical protein